MLFEAPEGAANGAAELVCKAMKTRTPSAKNNSADVEISRTISDQVLKKGASVLTSDAQQDPRFQERQSIVLGGLRSVMAVPLAVEGRISGMIYVDNPFHTNRFTDSAGRVRARFPAPSFRGTRTRLTLTASDGQNLARARFYLTDVRADFSPSTTAMRPE